MGGGFISLKGIKYIMAILIANNGNRVVETIADRNAIEKRHMGMSVIVKDSTADVRFGGGLVNYIWDSIALDWLPTYSSYKPDIKFSTESKTIIGGVVTTDYVVRDGMVWSAKILDADGLIVADAQVTAVGDKIQLPNGNWDGHKLYYTYAHGTMTTELYGLWESKAGTVSPAFEGIPTVPTPDPELDIKAIANVEFVASAIREGFENSPTVPMPAEDADELTVANIGYVGFAIEDAGLKKHETDKGDKTEAKVDTYTLSVSTDTAGTIDLNREQVVVLDGTVNNNISLTNIPDVNRAMTIVLKFKGKGGNVTWPSNIIWADDKEPVLADMFTVVVLMWDGEEWIGSAGMRR